MNKSEKELPKKYGVPRWKIKMFTSRHLHEFCLKMLLSFHSFLSLHKLYGILLQE